MVHPSEQGDGGNDPLPEDDDETTDAETPSNRSVDRRSYLKLAGAALTGGALASSATDTASARSVTQEDDYEVWEISGNEEYRLDDGEVLENVLIDQRANGAHINIYASGSEWTIRNVGILGSGDYNGHGGFQISARTQSGGHGLIENVYINQNFDGPTDSETGGLFVQNSHAGRIDVRHTYIEGNGNNAAYTDNAAKNGGGEGVVTFENCYHRDNTVAQYRIGSPGSYVKNCVGILDDPNGERGPYPNTSSQNARCVWGLHYSDLTIENSAFYLNPNDAGNRLVGFEATHQNISNGPGPVIDVINCDINEDVPQLTVESASNETVNFENLGHSPSVDVLQDGGVPTSPEMAALGERTMPPEIPAALPHHITIEGNGDAAHYEFSVSGDLVKSNDNGASIQDGDVIDGGTATGGVWSGTDSYRFDGELTDLALDGDATILVDGEEIDPFRTGEPELPHLVTIEGHGSAANYEFTVSGDVEKSVENNASIQDGDVIDGSTVTGGVWGGIDSFRFDGELTDFSLDGDATILVDGEEIDPADYGEPELPHLLTFDGTDGQATFEFTVSGDVEKSDENGASVNDGDVIDGSTVTGGVWGGIDSFRFDGEITDFTFDGTATVTLDGEEIDPADYGEPELPHLLTIEGHGSAANYEFTVSGDLEKSVENNASVNDGDVVDGGTATGGVWGGVDSFRFDGELTDFSLDGDATVLLDGNEIDPASFSDELPHLITIDGTSGRAAFQFTVSGDVEKSDENGASVNDGDVIDGSTVTGGVWGGIDSFRFDGELTDFTFDGTATVTLDGDEVDPDEIV